MKHSAEEQMREIMLRKRNLQRRRNKRTTDILSCAAVCLAVASAAVISVFAGEGTHYVSDHAYGAFLLSSSSGSYVLCMVAAFVFGSFFTAYCIRRKKKQDAEKEDKTAAPIPEKPDTEEQTRK